MIYDSILDTVGNTPVVRLNRIAPAGVEMFVKVEAFNPLGSVKDRLALAIINDAERSGALQPGQTVIEATSGNTGIALAMVCAARGYPFVATMVETFSIERRKIMRALGARVILTPAAEKGTGMVLRAAEAGRAARLVPGQPVRESRQSGLSPQHHRAGNPARFRQPESRLLGHRLGHGRHDDRRRRSHQARAAERAHRRH